MLRIAAVLITPKSRKEFAVDAAVLKPKANILAVIKFAVLKASIKSGPGLLVD